MKKSKRVALVRWAKWGGTILSVLLVVLLLREQDWKNVLEVLHSLSWQVLTESVLLFLLGQGFNSWRWHILLQSQEISISWFQTFRIMLAGSFASNFLPSTIGGDGIRVAGVIAFAPDRKSLAASSVVLDRLVNVLNMLVFLPVSFLFLIPLSNTSWRLSGVFSLGAFQKTLKAIWSSWAAQKVAIGKSFFVCFLSNLTPMFSVWVLAHGLHMPVSYGDVVAVSAVNYFVTLLPISINGYGVKELVYTLVYTALGATPLQASSLALVSRFALMLSTLPGGIIWWYARRS